MPKRDRQFWESERLNNAVFTQYYNRLTELSISMFEWTNLPESVDPRFLELALFADGMSIFFKDDVLGFLCLRCMVGGTWDVYNVPETRTAYATNGYQNRLNRENSVIIFNNALRTGSRLDVEVFARRLWDLDRTIDVNAKAQKTPILISCMENQRLTLKNLYMKYEGNEPFIFGDKNLTPDSLQVLHTDAPYIADKIQALKTQIWNEALTCLGISNVSYQKKERLISDEVIRNMGGVIANRYSRLNARRQACEEINKMFGLDIWCEYREDYREADDETMLADQTKHKEATDMVIDTRTKTPAAVRAARGLPERS